MPRPRQMSFRLRLLLATLVPLLASGALGMVGARMGTKELSRQASEQIGQGVRRFNEEVVLQTLDATADRTNKVLSAHVHRVAALARAMQDVQAHPATAFALGRAIADDPHTPGRLTRSPARVEDGRPVGGWSESSPNASSVITAWSYLHGPSGALLPDVQAWIERTALFDLIAPELQAFGHPSQQMVTIGPPDRPVLRATPYRPLGATYDRIYPGHQSQPFWDRFYPGLMEAWAAWGVDRTPPSGSDSFITFLGPYVDGTSGDYIISIMHPLWRIEGPGEPWTPAGAVGLDLTLAQIHDIIADVHVGEGGFAVLVDAEGNVLAVSDAGGDTLGLSTDDDDFHTPGVAAVRRRLADSSDPAVRDLDLGAASIAGPREITLGAADAARTYRVYSAPLRSLNAWRSGQGVALDTWTLGLLVPEDETLATVRAAASSLDESARAAIQSQTLLGLLGLLLAALGVSRVTRGILRDVHALTEAAERVASDPSARVEVDGDDELATLGHSFNAMAAEVERHTQHLEDMVAARTRELAAANDEISSLNARLQAENSRLEAELDIARRLQAMVLPHADELAAIQDLDVAGYMEPADEVGGDYYDVLSAGGVLKLGMGDVTGHGLASGVLMLMVQSAARTLIDAGVDDPVRFLSVLNAVVYTNLQRLRSDSNLTLCFVDFDGEALTLAGQHEELLVVRAGGAVERVDTMDLGLPVGVVPDIGEHVAARRLPFDPGDVVVLFTDGVTEAEDADGQLFGVERLCEVIGAARDGAARDIVEAVIAAVRAHIGEQRVFDDISLLVVKRPPARALGDFAAAPPSALRLDFDRARSGFAWAHCSRVADLVSRWLGACAPKGLGHPRAVSDIGYVVNELLENAWKFGEGSALGVRAAWEGEEVVLNVVQGLSEPGFARLAGVVAELSSRDHGELLVERIEASAAGAPGSGLGLLTLLADHGARLGWRAEPTPEGLRVTASARFTPS